MQSWMGFFLCIGMKNFGLFEVLSQFGVVGIADCKVHRAGDAGSLMESN